MKADVNSKLPGTQKEAGMYDTQKEKTNPIDTNSEIVWMTVGKYIKALIL